MSSTPKRLLNVTPVLVFLLVAMAATVLPASDEMLGIRIAGTSAAGVNHATSRLADGGPATADPHALIAAFPLDTTPPTAQLIKPAGYEDGSTIFVTGKRLLLAGTAQDLSGIKSAWFELCPEGTEVCQQQWNLSGGGWETIGDNTPAVATPGVPGQWQTTWDSTTMSDGFYCIRICAEDNNGHTNCLDGRADQPLPSNPYPDARWVYVNNRFEISLYPGWNLVSSPLLPYNTDIADVLRHLIVLDSVESVWAYQATNPAGRQWLHWRPSSAEPANTLLNWVDGQGYWVRMMTGGTLEIIGTWRVLENGDPPPRYPVGEGWNLIGYTHWNRPTTPYFAASTAAEYLALVGEGAQALVKYNAVAGVYEAVFYGDRMELGNGYWLASDVYGLIQP